MKKVLLISLLLNLATMGAFAQSRAIGVRFSNVLEVSYQFDAAKPNFWELDGGLLNMGKGAQASIIHNWIIGSPNWTSQGEWNWYLGVGGLMGLTWDNTYNDNGNLGCYMGVAGMFGLEYTFDFPLELSADVRPFVGPYINDGVSFNTRVLANSFFPTVSARYRF